MLGLAAAGIGWYVGGWIGARLFLIPTGWQYLVEDPFAFLFSSSGWVWYGGVVGGAVTVSAWWWFSARPRGMAFGTLTDIAAAPLTIGLAMGRVGCQLSGDGDYGIPTDLPWGMSFPQGVVPTTDRVHPTPIYEIIGCMGIFWYLWSRRSRPVPPGDQFARYLVLSGALRFPIEFVRRNPAWLVGLTTAQWLSLLMIALGAVMLRRMRDQGIQGSRDPESAPEAAVAQGR
jgi:phosphatidylglycerol:prolipoprotein diacylglycerol transferase